MAPGLRASILDEGNELVARPRLQAADIECGSHGAPRPTEEAGNLVHSWDSSKNLGIPVPY